MAERLQKLIARAGVASRRTAEQLIRSGAVRVNGAVVTALGSKADPGRDRIEVEGRRLRFEHRELHLLLHKPRGVLCTASDPKGRRTVFDFLRRVPRRVFTVGRLPYDAEGLLLLTSDGALADALLRSRLRQTWQFKVKGQLTDSEAERLRTLAGRRASSFRFRRVKPGANPWYEVELAEPRQDWLRTALFRLGHPVEKLRRVAVGSLRDSALAPGGVRPLTPAELETLRSEAAAPPG